MHPAGEGCLALWVVSCRAASTKAGPLCTSHRQLALRHNPSSVILLFDSPHEIIHVGLGGSRRLGSPLADRRN